MQVHYNSNSSKMMVMMKVPIDRRQLQIFLQILLKRNQLQFNLNHKPRSIRSNSLAPSLKFIPVVLCLSSLGTLNHKSKIAIKLRLHYLITWLALSQSLLPDLLLKRQKRPKSQNLRLANDRQNQRKRHRLSTIHLLQETHQSN